MAKIRRIRLKSRKYAPVPGDSPGSVQIYEGAREPKINAYAYNGSELYCEPVSSAEELDRHFKKYPSLTHWIDIRGVGNLTLFEYLGERFGIHKLVLEDISNIHQRPKIDEYDNYLFAVSRMLYINADLEIENEQISFILMKDVLFSFQENYTDNIGPVIQRLRAGKGNIRISGPSYMLYSLIDVIIDNYFELIYKLGDDLETIEELLYRRPDKTLMFQTQSIKRAMVMIRRAAWPERDKINDMIRSDFKLLNKTTRTFLKDTYDHTMQIIDLVESYKEVISSLIDMNLSLISNRMNEIMKVLTIISSIFIPLTFIAGVYGMNFAYQDPQTGEILKHNMPELYSENGYLYTLAGMLVIGIAQMLYFWRKGWLSNK